MPSIVSETSRNPGADTPVGYARVSTRGQDHQSQLDALAGAHCREVVVETASTRGEQPKLRATLDRLQPGDTLVICKPDRVARSMKELLVFVEDELHARGIVLEILTGVCAGVHRPDGAGLADRLLFARQPKCGHFSRTSIMLTATKRGQNSRAGAVSSHEQNHTDEATTPNKYPSIAKASSYPVRMS
ncbi:recombinase family protein [Streptosporangium canum]|uniref:recombinase family protein n=1 Tax=Streptosporangium canum TaxID=324952 RepID=UPI003414E6FC